MLQFACSGEIFSRSLWIYRVIWFFEMVLRRAWGALLGVTPGFPGNAEGGGTHLCVPARCRGTHAGRWVTALPRGRPR